MAFVPGHMAIDPTGLECACGQRGCLVTVAGPEVVVTAAGLGGVLAEEGVTTAVEELLARAEAGDPAARAALGTAGAWLGRFLNLLVVGLDPSAIVLGGYWARALDYLRDGIDEAFALLAPTAREAYHGPSVLPAALGARANVVGAVDQAIRACFDELTDSETV